MGDLLDKAFETPAVILTDGNQVTGGLLTSTSDDAWIAEPDAPIGSVHYKTDGTRQTRIAFTGSGVADDFASENPLAVGGGASVSFSWRFSTSTVEADPGNGRLRYDNAVPANVTALFVDDFDNAGIDVSGILNQIPNGTRIYLQEQAVSGNFLIGTITAITDQTGFFKIELTVDDSGTLPANNKVIGVLFFGAAGGAGTPGDQAALQIRRSTNLTFTDVFVDVDFDLKDFENDPTVVDHDALTDRINLKQTGPYRITFRVDTDQAAPAGTNWQAEVRARVRVNDTGSELPGSLTNEQALEDGSLVGDRAVWPSLKADFIYNATAGDFLTLQIAKVDSDAGTDIRASAFRTVMTATRMTGETGPAGSGSNLIGANVSNSASQAIATATPFILAFNTDDDDPDGMHDPVTNNSRITIPTGEAGTYLFGFNARWEGNSTGVRTARLIKNGTTIVATLTEDGLSINHYMLVSFPRQFGVVATDFFEVEVEQNSGGGLDLESQPDGADFDALFWAQRVR